MKINFGHLTLLLALALAGSAGFFSVLGLSQLFAGAATSVIILGSTLELSKIIATTALHRYWTKIALGLRIYVTVGVLVLMLVTSGGIYGFLSSAYQKTATKLELHEGQVGVIGAKKLSYQKKIDDNQAILNTKNKRIELLTNLRTNQETRLDVAKSNSSRDKVRSDIQKANDEIKILYNDIDVINATNSTLGDSVSQYNIMMLDMNSKSEVAGEVGPLRYISELTNLPMAKVVNILILFIIFVFDPLAIALVLISNIIFEAEKKKDDVVNDVVNDAIENNLDMSLVADPATKDVVMNTNEGVTEGVNEGVKPKKESVVPTGKIQLEDIREIKKRATEPKQKSTNSIERIGSNKMKDGDNQVIFKRK